MFGKKRRRPITQIEVWAGEKLIAEGPMEEFQFQEPGIIAMSNKLFNDSDPCEIHRGAVRWQALLAMESASGGARVSVDALEPEVKAALLPEATTFRVREVEG